MAKFTTQKKSGGRFFKLATASLAAALLATTAACLCACNPKKPIDPSTVYEKQYASTSKVGYEARILNEVKRIIPQEKNEGLSVYPVYGTTLTDVTREQMLAIYEEAYYLTPTGLSKATNDTLTAGGSFNKLDKNGYLYLNDQPALDSKGNHRKLYKHTTAANMFYGEVPHTEKAVKKQITVSPRSYTKGYSVTGLYAPAGEVIKIEISGEDMRATEGLSIHIGQALYNGQSNNISDGCSFIRMPNNLSTYEVNQTLAEYNAATDTYTAYIGSYYGGPLYIRNETQTYTVTISGGLTYSHFILGYTSPQEFAQNSQSKVPYFDLEVWDSGVLHSGPKKYAEGLSYDDLYNVAVLWDKIARISTQVEDQGVVFCYDPFIAAGAACAWPGRSAVTCPSDWMASALNYESMIENGSWGNIHEYNHNFQKWQIGYWGLGDGVEVTNNVLNLVAYGMHTNVSAKRQLGNLDEGLGDWNKYTNPSWALRDITEGRFSNEKKGLSTYANYYHSFGQDIMLNAINRAGSGSVDNWLKATTDASGYDMTYYYKDLIGLEVSDSVLSETAAKNYPMFVPVASIYQTGRSYISNGKTAYSQTARPYRIPANEEFEIDLGRYTIDGNNYVSGSIVLPDGFSYRIANVSTPDNGELAKLSETKYKYIPNAQKTSGKIYVKLEITKDDNAFAVDDVELVFEFEQSKEFNKTLIERTTYTFATADAYSSAKEAYEAGYAGYTAIVEGDNDNTFSNGRVVQDCSAEVWLERVNANQILEIKGKYYIKDAGKYRLALRGRHDCVLYASTDGVNYKLAAEYTTNANGSPDFPLTDGTYSDYNLDGGSWLYFKGVMLCQSKGGKNAFIGVGLGKFDKEGNVNVSKVNAYRNSYIQPETFVSDYYYQKNYNYDYKDNVYYRATGEIIDVQNYSPWSQTDHLLSNLLDGDKNTYIHTNYDACEEKPLVLTIDLKGEYTVNRLTLYTQPRWDYHCPISFKIEGSLDGQEWFNIGSYNDLTVKDYSVCADFDECTIKYYRISFTKSSNRYIIISEAELARVFEINGAKQISLDENNIIMKGDWQANYELSSFGHTYYGAKDSSVEYEFVGNRFGILTTDKDSAFEVYIDGVLTPSISLKEDSGVLAGYICEELSNQKHTVVIKSANNVKIDSLLVWQ